MRFTPASTSACGAELRLVLPLHLSNRQPALARHPQHAGSILEGVGPDDIAVRIRSLRLIALGRRHDETAADRIVGLREDFAPIPVVGREDQTVGVAGQRLPEIEDDVAGRVEGEGRQPGVPEDPLLIERGEFALGARHVDVRRHPAEETERHGPIGRVTLAREGERAMQADFNRRGGPGRGGAIQKVEEGAGRRHRPHRMRRRGADPDFENVENTEEHEGRSRFGEKPTGAPSRRAGRRRYRQPAGALPRPGLRWCQSPSSNSRQMPARRCQT